MADQGGDNVIIRTMKDDLTGPSSAPLASLNPSTPTTSPTLPKPSQPPPLPAPKIPTNFPLPARQEEAAVGLPHVAARNRRRLIMWSSLVIVLVAALGGGIWAFMAFFAASPQGSPSPTVETVAPVSALIASNTTVAAYYHLDSATTRSQMLSLWQNSLKTLLQGNPKSLVENPTVTQFLYVILEGDSRPYLLIPKSETSEQQLATLSPSQVSEYQGWNIIHALNASPYLAAIPPSTVLSANQASRLDNLAIPMPIKIFFGEAALNQIRTTTASSAFAIGSIHTALMGAIPNPTATALLLDGFGQESSASSPLPSPSLPPQIDQNLLAAIPADATFVRLGGNLFSDITSWQNVARVLDKSILEQPAVAALVGQFTGPYAYYQRTGADGLPDTGLVIPLPGSLTPPLALGDKTLEAALPALTPLILGQKPAVTPAFADGSYQGTALRFANLASSGQALDYALTEKRLYVATSKEGMLAALDVALSKSPALLTSSPWKNLLKEWGVVPASPELFLGFVSYAPLVDLLPTSANSLPIAISQVDTISNPQISGMILLPPTPASPIP